MPVPTDYTSTDAPITIPNNGSLDVDAAAVGSGGIVGGVVGGICACVALIIAAVLGVRFWRKRTATAGLHRGNADEIRQGENRRNTMQMEENPMLAVLRAKKAAQTTSHTVMNAAYSDSEQAPGDYATIDEVPTTEGGTTDAELYTGSGGLPSHADYSGYDVVATAGGGSGYAVPVDDSADGEGTLAKAASGAAPASANTAADDGLYDVPALGANDEYLTVTA